CTQSCRGQHPRLRPVSVVLDACRWQDAVDPRAAWARWRAARPTDPLTLLPHASRVLAVIALLLALTGVAPEQSRARADVLLQAPGAIGTPPAAVAVQ